METNLKDVKANQLKLGVMMYDHPQQVLYAAIGDALYVVQRTWTTDNYHPIHPYIPCRTT